jgi:hypothetical protein
MLTEAFALAGAVVDELIERTPTPLAAIPTEAMLARRAST